MNFPARSAFVDGATISAPATATDCCRDCEWLRLSLALFVILWWQSSGWDLAVSRYFGTAQGFVWQHHWFFEKFLHTGTKWLCVLIYAGLLWNYFQTAPARFQIPRTEQRFWFAVAMLSLVTVSALKYKSGVSCPWDLQQFGGQAVLENRWSWHSDGGPGRCFPSGHVSAAFSLLALPFALRSSNAKLARQSLFLVLTLAAVMSFTQVVRGAHLLSHVAYSGWLCWAWCVAADSLYQRVRRAAGPPAI